MTFIQLIHYRTKLWEVYYDMPNGKERDKLYRKIKEIDKQIIEGDLNESN